MLCVSKKLRGNKSEEFTFRLLSQASYLRSATSNSPFGIHLISHLLLDNVPRLVPVFGHLVPAIRQITSVGST